MIDSAPLLGTEVVTNSVRHSGAPTAHAVAARVQVTRTTVRLEVEDSGRGGMIARRPPDPERGGGFGWRLVQALSERSGLERVAEGGTRLWAQPRRTPDRDGGDYQHIRRPSLSKPDQPADGRRPAPATPAGGQP